MINRKHLGLSTLLQVSGIAGRLLLHGQTNFIRMLWRFNRVYNGNRQYEDHQRPVPYQLPRPAAGAVTPGRRDLFIHARPRRQPDPATPASASGDAN